MTSQTDAPTPLPQVKLWPERYDLIDAWRGIAASIVVFQHVGAGHDLGLYGVLAFFVISGYCICAAAESSIRRGHGLGFFMWRRVRRIFPPYLFGILFFWVTRVIKAHRGGPAFFPKPMLMWVQNLTLTQWLYLIRHPAQRAFENPILFVDSFWTLCYEEQFYLVSGLLILAAGWMRRRNLLVVLTLIALGWNLRHLHICYGFFLDYWVLFAIGGLLFYRLCRMRNRKMRALVDACFIGFAIVCGAIAFTRPEIDGAPRPIFLEFFVASTFALTLLWMRPLSERFSKLRIGRVLMALGLISYSLYLIHEFNLVLVGTVVGKIIPRSAPDFVSWIAQTFGHILIATAFWFACERPFLNRRIVPGAAASGPISVPRMPPAEAV